MTIVRAAVAHALRAATALTIGLASTTYAQTPAGGNEQSAGGNQTLDEVTVTGSRIRRTTDFDTANPTTVVDDSYLRNLGIVNVGDAVAQMPANLSTQTPATTGNANFFTGSTIANLRGLNPFFGSRTLNLVNSQRFVPTNQGDGVDLNFIPSILIDRVDIVTGGASAAYGSGAIAGVNNIFLNRKLEGGKADIDFARTDENDGDERHVGLAYGAGLFDNRAHFVVGYEYEKTDPIGCYRVRDWCHEGNGIYQNQNPTPGAAFPTWLLGSDIRSNQMSLTGTFYNSSRSQTQTLQSNATGNGAIPFNMGQQPYSGASATQVVPGGDGKSIYQYTNLRAPIKRNIATGTFTMALTDSVNMNVDLSYGKVETTDINGALDATNMQITPQNAYIQGNSLAAAQLQFRQGGTGPNALNAIANKDWTSQVDSHSTFTTDVKRAVIGFDGKFGTSSWGWDAYYQYGLTNREQLVVDNRHLNAYNLAIDTILDPVTNQPRCRFRNAAEAAAGGVTFDPRIANGCVPLNPFGTQALTQAQHDYAFGNLDENLRYEQQVLALSASGDLLKGFAAGPIQGAIGAEYRVEKGDNIATVPGGTPDYVRTDYLIQYGESFAGDVDVTEGFVELNVPVFRDVTFARKLEFNMSARESEYKNTGREGTTGEKRTHDMFTWKISGIWDPVDWLRVRATQSRDSRAANFRELYYRQIIGAGGTFGFCDSPPRTPRDPCTFDLRGNVNLKPEKSDTTTIGLVFTPTEFLSGFNFAADYFRINIQDAILQASSTSVLNGCRNLAIQTFCNQLVLGPPATPGANPLDNIDLLNAFATNGSGYTFKGVDITSSYQHDVGENSNVYIRLLGTRMISQLFQSQPGGAFINVVGQTGTGNSFLSDNQPAAKWIANLSTTFNHGPYSMTGQVRYVGKGIMDYNGVVGRLPTPLTTERSMSVNHVPSYQVFSLSGSYMFENLGVLSSLQIFGVVDNVFDRDPPIAPGSGPATPSNANGGTNAVYFDTQGRTFRLGVRTTF